MSNFPILDTINTPGDLKSLTIAQLNQLSNEIRQFVLQCVSKTGGHLASNLGIVELTLALHYTFSSPFDQLIWDVGHQTYVHKILTGRKELFQTLRQYGGLSGFPKRRESPHDVFETGHSSTSISAALGLARARDLKGEHHHIVAVIGDGALSGGMAFEALNDVGNSGTDLIVVLNDNEMSISKNVGALSTHLNKIRSNPKYKWIKKEVDFILRKVPVLGEPLKNIMERFKNSFKYLFVQGIIFEEMGFNYIGPIDGHNLSQLIAVMKQAKLVKGPVLVHVVTQKGKGYIHAEKNPEKFHGVPPFDIETGQFGKAESVSYSKAFGKHLQKLAAKDNRIVAITAAMPEGTGLLDFKRQFPDRFFDVGIAEQHAVTMAAGMATAGMKPYVAIYSSFLQRAYDQILHDVCIQNLPVVFAVDRAGLVGEDGETHQGVFDLSYLSHMPNITILAPRNIHELIEMMDYSLSAEGPVAIRYPKCSQEYADQGILDPFKLRWEVLEEGEDCVILAVGSMVSRALEAAHLLRREKIYPKIINARIVKPLDEAMLSAVTRIPCWITLEENSILGGFGSMVNGYIMRNRLQISALNLGIPDHFIPHGRREQLFHELGLDGTGIAFQVKELLGSCRGKAYVNF